MRILGNAGLVTREACGNTVRNVAGDPLSGVKPEEPFYVAPYLTAYARYFVRHEYTQVLPRKWKTAFSSGGKMEKIFVKNNLFFTLPITCSFFEKSLFGIAFSGHVIRI